MSPLLRLEDLVVHYRAEQGLLGPPARGVRAVDGVTLEVARGEVLGLVGESGCGKTTLARAALRLIEPLSGRVLFDGEDVTGWSRTRLRPLRRRMQPTFQDPGSALDPRMTVGEAVGEALSLHGLGGPDPRARVHELLGQVGLAAEHADRHPHELSGGQRQRVVLARALAVEPQLLVLDEPTAGLDVSVQAQIVNLLADLQEKLGLAYLVVSHDLRVVAHLADRVAVMYLGRVVEEGPAERLLGAPAHPYMRALLQAASAQPGAGVEGEPPSPVSPPSGCRFHPRCPVAIERCRTEDPAFRDLGAGHRAACLRAGEGAAQGAA